MIYGAPTPTPPGSYGLGTQLTSGELLCLFCLTRRKLTESRPLYNIEARPQTMWRIRRYMNRCYAPLRNDFDFMKLGIVGLQGSGKTTIFEALTGSPADLALKAEDRQAIVKVPDERIDKLSAMYNPRKTIYAQVEYFLPGHGAKDQGAWQNARTCDALIHVVRNFTMYGAEAPAPLEDIKTLDQELILADLAVVEKRLERMAAELKRGKKPNPEEQELLQACLEKLNNEESLRHYPELASNPLLRGFTLLSAKPMLMLFNNDDENSDMPEAGTPNTNEIFMVMRGKLEQELSSMEVEEVREFLQEFGIAESGMDRVIISSYALLGLQAFFTVGEDEVRAWTIHANTEALDAADEIHSDIKKGFIRAEVLAYDDLMTTGAYAEARKKGLVRLEGKTYLVKDGDIINFRFNV